MLTDALALTVFAALTGVVVVLAKRRERRVLARRASLLDPCAALFSETVKRLDATGFPRMAGTAQGLRWDVQVVPDALALRKLPALWLLVSLPEPIPLGGTLHLLLRPTGAEGFTRFRNLPNQHDLPEGFPHDAALRSDNAAMLAHADLLRPLLPLWRDKLKEIILSPKGLRVTLLMEEADRKNYLILRQTDLGQAPVDISDLSCAISTLAGLSARFADPKEKTAA